MYLKNCAQCSRQLNTLTKVNGKYSQLCQCKFDNSKYVVSKMLASRRKNKVFKSRLARKKSIYGTIKTMTLIAGLMCTVGLFSPTTLTYTAMASTSEALETPVEAKIAITEVLPPKPDSPQEVKEYILAEAEKVGVHVPKIAYIVENESHWRKDAVGDMNITCKRTGKPFRSRGPWQLSECYYPHVSDECAFDAVCSTEIALNIIANSKADCISQWTTCRRWHTIKGTL